MYRRFRNKFVLAIAAVLAGIVVFLAIGVYVNTTAVRIYDQFPDEFVCYPPDSEKLTCDIWNSAPMSVPYLNPFYTLHVTIIDSENNAFAYFIGIGNKERNFTGYSLDLGRIDAGNSRSFNLYLHPNEGNVTFRIEVFFSFANIRLLVATKTYSVEYLGDNEFTLS